MPGVHQPTIPEVYAVTGLPAIAYVENLFPELKDADGTDKSKAALIGHSNYLFTQEHYQSDTIEELAALVASFE